MLRVGRVGADWEPPDLIHLKNNYIPRKSHLLFFFFFFFFFFLILGELLDNKNDIYSVRFRSICCKTSGLQVYSVSSDPLVHNSVHDISAVA